jgi:hypothetical protein
LAANADAVTELALAVGYPRGTLVGLGERWRAALIAATRGVPGVQGLGIGTFVVASPRAEPKGSFEMQSKASVTACLVFALSLPALAANPKIDAAITTFKSVAADAGKLKIFCEMKKTMDAAGEKADPATDEKVDGYIKQLGAEFQKAWNTGDDLDENSPDAKALYAALDDLGAKCK